MRITLKNYRCFPDSQPAQFEIRPGLTALVGTNNAGKSSLLKFFHEFRGLFNILSSFQGDFATSTRTSRAFPPSSSIFDIAELFCNANGRDLTITFELSDMTPPSVPAQVIVTVPHRTNTFTTRLLFPGRTINTTALNVEDTRLRSPNTNELMAELAPFCSEFRALADTFYIGPFRNAINVGTNANYFDIQVGQSFITRWRALKTGNVKRDNELILKVTEDIERIFEFEQLLIDASDDGQTLQAVINRKSYKLPELGSGLTQFILVLGNAAIRQPGYILIDEPELNLHPSLMLDFLTTLASYSRIGVVFGTHSIGLARAAADRVYSLRKIQEGESQLTPYEATPRLSEFLGELSFSGYQELGGEKVLLVEGPKDVKTIQQFLRLHRVEHRIVFLPLGGNTLINASAGEQLTEIKRISQYIYALVDSERPSAGAALSTERQGFVTACQNAEIECHVLDRRAIENYFPDRAVKRVKGSCYRALQPFERLGDITPNWSKSENWRIAREMTLDDLAGTDLGAFLIRLSTS